MNCLASSAKDKCFAVLCGVAGAASGVNPGIYKQENPLAPREPPAMRNDDGKPLPVSMS